MTPRFVAIIAALATALVGPFVSDLAQARTPDNDELMQLQAASGDPARAAGAVDDVRRMLASDLDSEYVPFARQVLLRALMTSQAPVAEIAAAADTAAPLIGTDPRQRIGFYGRIAGHFVERDAGKEAVVFAEKALAEFPAGEDFGGMRVLVKEVLGYAYLKAGEPKRAIEVLEPALASAPDSQDVLHALGDAYLQSGAKDRAIDYYVRSLAVFPPGDTTAAEPLRKLYAERHGSLAGLDARVSAARDVARQRVALDDRRHERPAPAWQLHALDGKLVDSGQFKGRVVVIDFWGSWCGPCRAELPHFQAVYEQYKGRGVAFVGINWEREKGREKSIETARAFIEKGGYTFPVVVDHERKAIEAYKIESFPTVFLIDKAGTIRYANYGYTEGIAHILGAQIESLLD